MNVYQIAYPDGYYEWVAGESKTRAIASLLEFWDVCGLRELHTTGVSMTVLPQEALNAYCVTDEEGNAAMTFAAWLQENPEGGVIAYSFC